ERGGLPGLARDTAADTGAGGAATREAAVARTATEGTASGGADSGGAVVGAGQTTRAVGGAAELTAVAVAEPYRRRGIAAAVSAFLTDAAHRRGAGLVWLEAAGPDEQRVYERVGYRHVGEK